MAFTFEDLIDSLRSSRSNFHKHLEGLREDQIVRPRVRDIHQRGQDKDDNRVGAGRQPESRRQSSGQRMARPQSDEQDGRLDEDGQQVADEHSLEERRRGHVTPCEGGTGFPPGRAAARR